MFGPLARESGACDPWDWWWEMNYFHLQSSIRNCRSVFLSGILVEGDWLMYFPFINLYCTYSGAPWVWLLHWHMSTFVRFRENGGKCNTYRMGLIRNILLVVPGGASVILDCSILFYQCSLQLPMIPPIRLVHYIYCIYIEIVQYII
ncbi:hypothetical protein XELAEV_18000447mg [Xenopus laevis]|uniref:Uncharacterized protein n=1 Tax=Xenopus laevis TaxID=8355 RepID=A0A974BQ87_XENLA|nr:hypothetical protein XELAEV_18000447mg [Xenopus laevis]